MERSDDQLSLAGLAGAVVLAFCAAAVVGHPPRTERTFAQDRVPMVTPSSAHARSGGNIVVRSTGGGPIRLGSGADGEMVDSGDRVVIQVVPDVLEAARTLSIPLSVNWRHPVAGLPCANVLRFAERDRLGRSGPERIHTVLFADHCDLPVVSLVVPSGSLFDPDTGIMVVGNAILHAPKKVLITEYRDPRSWKYPGNFHMRGKAWERKGRMQYIDPEGYERFQSEVDVRINGQMTRSFPQHAFRLTFPDPVQVDFFDEPVGDGYGSIVLRAAGNDQIRAMLRDVFQHDLCAGLPFEVSGHRTCVLYLNGAYWGVHHIRPRMDETELARRYDIRTEDITILEDEARLYRGDTMEVIRFERLADRTDKWDGADEAWVDTLYKSMDVDGFLSYMATQMILANMDWPSQNVKYWRYTGEPRPERLLDGRWYFIMGDADLGYGVRSSANVDLFVRANALDVPITKLLRGMLRNPGLRVKFIRTARELATGPFSTARSLQRLEHIVGSMAPEMERHTARWRRPGSVAAWQAEVDVMRTFAKEREAAVLKQLDAFERKGP